MTVTVTAGLSLPWCSTRIKTNFSFMEHFLGLFRDSSSVLFPRLFPWSDLWAPVPLLLVSHSSSSAHTSGGAHHCPSGGVSSCLWVIPFDSFYSNPGWAILALVHIWYMWNTHAPFAHATRYMLLLLLFFPMLHCLLSLQQGNQPFFHISDILCTGQIPAHDVPQALVMFSQPGHC